LLLKGRPLQCRGRWLLGEREAAAVGAPRELAAPLLLLVLTGLPPLLWALQTALHRYPWLFCAW
jgi:hypothetical protein